ncbi:bile acid:sodium symporter family protein [Virgibacillus salexigens]|uniref:Sodium transporter n=1 Tax=Virgibacillus kapii TaxID=1638645 RepID=A0ABQ2DHV8_9BACI|nr:bile acid:sodium symporter family protein [Virgibacillus kapii]GGJ58216.1 sodium transporter [Virgibacillus kapii]
MKTINFISTFANKYFALITILVAILAFNLPNQFLWLNSYINILLGIVMFGMGMNMKPVDLKLVLTKPITVLIGVLIQFSIMPLIAYGIATLLQLPPMLAAGIILVGCVPGGTASNVMVYLAKGNVALSIAMTSFSTLLSPMLTPLLLYLLAGQWMPVNPFAMFLSIIQVIIIPIALGIIIQKFLPNIVEKSSQALPFISVIAISGVVAAVVSGNTENIAASGILIFLTVIIHNLSGLLLGYVIAMALRLDADMRRAISIEVGIQNAGLGVSLANTHFAQQPLTALPGAVAVVTHVINGSILATIWSRRPIRKKTTDVDKQRSSSYIS